WLNFRGLFRAIDEGNAGLNIPAYNGGLFAPEPTLDALHVPDEVCAHFKELGDYDYRPAREVADAAERTAVRSVIDVDILGHIFEQSITDLERLRQNLAPATSPQSLATPALVGTRSTASPSPPDTRDAVERVPTTLVAASTEPEGALAEPRTVGRRRKQEGAVYTPAFITRYLVEQALGGVLKTRFDTLRRQHEAEAAGTARKTLADPNAYDPTALNEPQRKALIRFWEAWQEELKRLRILDLACGSGAILIEAFNQLHAVYDLSNARLEELRGQRTLFDLDRQILQNNLYGVDLNEEAIQICQLSLWIKTAARGKQLTSLDHTIREGNSVIGDPAVHPKTFDWQAAFPEVFAQGAFDVVLGNPPCIRLQLLRSIKPWLEAHCEVFHGMADLYVYFYESGVRLMKPGGLLCFIVTNKWMKAGYGEPLRRFFSEKAWVRSVVDFGHAKQIFEEVDVFPSIILVEKPNEAPKPKTARLCTIPREQLRIDDLSVQIEREGFEIQQDRLGQATWNLDRPAVTELLHKIGSNGIPLKEFANLSPLYGIKTGFNEAFLISDEKRKELVAEDRTSEEVLRPYLRGQDIGRWSCEWANLWMIVLPSSTDKAWPWATLDEGAEGKLKAQYPSVYGHLKPLEERLRKREDQGKYWWELRPCAYWQEFLRPKLCIQRIAFHSRVALDSSGMLLNDAAIILPTVDAWLMACLNS